MLIIHNKSKDATYNIAFEEYILKRLKTNEDILIFWQNENAIIVGRNQNTLEQVNKQKADELGIKIVRRLSGGGTVYHDLGNVNFTFITNFKKTDVNNYDKFTRPIINALRDEFGLNANFSGKNDIEIDGKKISGNAQLLWKDRFMSHGTILFNINTSILSDLLYVDKSKLVSKGIKSVRARVTNIKPLLDKEITSEQFVNTLIKYFQKAGNKLIQVDKDIDSDVIEMADKKYRTWDWNFGKSPEMNINNKVRFEGAGLLNVQVNVSNGLIKDIRFLGDYMSSQDVGDIENKLINVKYDPEIVKEKLSKFDIPSYFGQITIKDILSVMFQE